jgi:Protein of unknown function (DUF2971)
MAPPDDPTEEKFVQYVKYLSALGYFERRQELWHRVTPRLPRFLYKFRSVLPTDAASVDRLRDVIVRSRLYLASPLSFNDPYDMSGLIELGNDAGEVRKTFDAFLKRRGVKYADRKGELRRIMASGIEGLRSAAQRTFQGMSASTGVCSFGGNPRNILMWTHYANNHEGICLQFELARDVKTFAQALPVDYSEDYPKLNWVRMNRDKTANTDMILKVLLRKFKRWAYEEEHRIIIAESAGQHLPFLPSALTALIIGSRARDRNVEQLKELLTERSAMRLPPPKIYRASKHPSKYWLLLKKP